MPRRNRRHPEAELHALRRELTRVRGQRDRAVALLAESPKPEEATMPEQHPLSEEEARYIARQLLSLIEPQIQKLLADLGQHLQLEFDKVLAAARAAARGA